MSVAWSKRCDDTAASRDNNEHHARLAEHCSFRQSSGIMTFVFSFIYCALAFAFQTVGMLKDSSNLF